MEEVDFSECEFIDAEMRIYTYYDFCDNRKEIKQLFDNLSKNGKRFYMWYIYSNIHMDETFKNYIWSYLNDYDEYGLQLLNAKRFYKVK